jgi:hypothetical protein
MNYDASADMICAFGEDTPGGVQQILCCKGFVTAILAHGPGNGVRGNIPAIFASRVFTKMTEFGEPFENIVAAVADTLQDNESTGRHSFFAMIQAAEDGRCQVAQRGMAPLIFLRRGLDTPVKMINCEMGGHVIGKAELSLKVTDTLLLFSDSAAAHWQRPELTQYLTAAYQPRITAQKLTGLLLNSTLWLAQKKPVDDLCVMTLRALKSQISVPERVTFRERDLL